MTKWKWIASCALCAVGVALAGCASSSVESAPVTGDLAPGEPGSYAAGAKWQGVDNGEDVTITLVSTDGKTKQFEESTGCKWTEDENTFAPVLTWDNCGGSGSGTQTIVSTEGDIWPLKVGNTQSWKLTGKDSTGGKWSTTRNCAVNSAERITTKAGAFDTYKVVCLDDWNTTTYYYSPQLKDSLVSMRIRKGKGLQSRWDYVSGPSLVASAN